MPSHRWEPCQPPLITINSHSGTVFAKVAVLGPTCSFVQISDPEVAKLFSATKSDYVTIHMQSLCAEGENAVEERRQRGDRRIRVEKEVWGCARRREM